MPYEDQNMEALRIGRVLSGMIRTHCAGRKCVPALEADATELETGLARTLDECLARNTSGKQAFAPEESKTTARHYDTQDSRSMTELYRALYRHARKCRKRGMRGVKEYVGFLGVVGRVGLAPISPRSEIGDVPARPRNLISAEHRSALVLKAMDVLSKSAHLMPEDRDWIEKTTGVLASVFRDGCRAVPARDPDRPETSLPKPERGSP